MQTTIISDKLPRLSVDEFRQKFRNVHAQQTREMASSLDIISQYVQGLFLPSATSGAMQLSYLPLMVPWSILTCHTSL